MPVLSRRCFNPLAMQLEPAGSVRIRMVPDSFHRPKLIQDPFGLDDSLHLKADSTPALLAPAVRPSVILP